MVQSHQRSLLPPSWEASQLASQAGVQSSMGDQWLRLPALTIRHTRNRHAAAREAMSVATEQDCSPGKRHRHLPCQRRSVGRTCQVGHLPCWEPHCLTKRVARKRIKCSHIIALCTRHLAAAAPTAAGCRPGAATPQPPEAGPTPAHCTSGASRRRGAEAPPAPKGAPTALPGGRA